MTDPNEQALRRCEEWEPDEVDEEREKAIQLGKDIDDDRDFEANRGADKYYGE